MMTRFRLLSIVAAASTLSGQAIAADCPIERAVYAEPQTSIELRFKPSSGENTPVTHGFELIPKAAKLKLEGNVIFDPEIERPVARVLNSCPEGDVTGADLAACTIWTGIIYGADKATGKIDVLPAEGANAPDSIVFPGFGPAYAQSKLGQSLSATPWDVFEYKDCVK